MRFWIALSLALLIYSPVYAGWTVDSLDYTTRKKITIQTANVDTDLTNFPLYVYVNADSDIADSNADGYDIRFTQSDGSTLLKYERESWTGGSGSNVTADFWVKSAVADGAGESATDIYIYYRTTDTADGEDATNVWDADYIGVYHMNDNTNKNIVFVNVTKNG